MFALVTDPGAVLFGTVLILGAVFVLWRPAQ